VTYCDSSFLVSLFTETESFSSSARELSSSFEGGIALPWLVELEVLTSLRRILQARELRQALHSFTRAQSQGILIKSEPQRPHYWSLAMDLSKRYAAKLKCRTLDLLHVALALELKLQTFASFDKRQRQLAHAVRLKILPQHLR